MPDRKTSAPSDPKAQTAKLSAALTPYTSYLLWQATSRAQERIRGALAPFGLRIPHHSVMRVLAEGARSQAALADLLQTDKMMMVRVVDDLEAARLVRREPSVRDRRAYDVTITPFGEDRLRQTHALMQTVDETFLGALSDAEQIQFRALLLRIIRAHDDAT